MRDYDCIVLGAGMAGLCAAISLNRRGQSVLVIDKKELGAASLAAAGILDPLLEMEKESPILPLALQAFKYYPKFLKQIEKSSENDVGYEKTGMLLVSTTEREKKDLRVRYGWHQKTGVPVKWLSGEAARKKERGLTKKVNAGLFYPTVGRVQPARLTQAVRKAAVRKGVQFKKTVEDSLTQIKAGKFYGLKLGKQGFVAKQLVVASGGWAGLEKMNRRRIPVVPVRGQISLVKGRLKSRIILHASKGYYVVPWGTNELLLGSTVERIGYRPGVTQKGQRQIIKGVESIIPEISEWKQIKSWSGLRPFCKDRLPLIGPTRTKGIAFATGFFRSGILLSPFVGELLAESLLGGRDKKMLAPFLPRRFGF